MNFICTICNYNARWYNPVTRTHSPYCTSCYKQMHPPAIQGQPLCQICTKPAFYNGKRWSSACGKGHLAETNKRGLPANTPR